LYEINDDPKRKEFLDDLFSFMQKRGSPINRLPIMAKSVLDLYELYNLVIARGGLVDVINKKLWQEIIKGLHLPSSITSAAFTLRTQYMKYLYPYECEKKNLSTPAELQAAIDGNRREGRRSSYGQFDQQMQGQLQMQRSPTGLQQMSPLSLVTHGNAPNSHHRMMGGPPLGQMANVVPHDIEQRMIEYIKMFQPKEPRRSQSPELLQRDALNALEMSRVALWSMYNNNTSPPVSINTISPPNHEPQREALNLAESPPHIPNVKRERERSSDYHERDRDIPCEPPQKRAVPIDKSLQRHNSSSMHHDDRSRTPMNDHDVSDDPAHSSSPIRNGISNISSGSTTTVLSGMQFKITSRGNAANGEQQLVVTMELNGVQYEGVLFANPTTNSTNASTPTKTNPNSSHNPIDERETNRVARPLVSS
ncbi:protein dead ringer-like, partial [Bradysia coprophila]|uniref:protein dead ringer-like n=2 Tax=Bradysia coprophila TaxID=38358 RepID=UPI00187DCEA0